MIYIEYELLLAAQRLTVEKYEEVLDEQEKLFAMTQPQGMTYDRDVVQSTPTANAIEKYLEAKERAQIDQRKKELQEVITDRQMLITLKRAELMASKAREDVIYRMRVVEAIPVTQIAVKVHYSREQVYRILRRIKQKIKDATK